MAIGTYVVIADGAKRAWPHNLATVPYKVLVGGVEVAWTLNAAGEIDVGSVPASGTAIQFVPSPTEADYSLAPGENVHIRNLPLFGSQYVQALRKLFDTAGTLSGTTSWWAVIDEDLLTNHANSLDEKNALLYAPWAVSGTMLTYIRATLVARFGWSSLTADVRMTKLADVARSERLTV